MKRLKELRNQRGLTQTQIGELIGVSCVTIARYEAGEREPSNAKITKLADFFGVSVDYLMGRDEPQDQNTLAGQWDEEISLLSQLDEQAREQARQYMQFLISQRK